GGKRTGGIEGRERIEIRGEQGARPLPDRCRQQPGDACAPFAAAEGLWPAEIIEAGAGIGVADAEGSRLPAQMHQHAHQHGVLDGGWDGETALATLDGARCMRYLKGYISRIDAQLRSAD